MTITEIKKIAATKGIDKPKGKKLDQIRQYRRPKATMVVFQPAYRMYANRAPVSGERIASEPFLPILVSWDLRQLTAAVLEIHPIAGPFQSRF